MTSISPSSSPRWDSRNQGFISPAQLQQWKQQQRMSTHEYQSEEPPQKPSQPPADMQRITSRQSISAPSQPPPHTHSRTISAFSIFKRHGHHDNTSQPQAPQKEASDPPKQPNVLRRGSTNLPPSKSQTQVPMSSGNGSQPLPDAPASPSATSGRPSMTSATPPTPTPPPPLHAEIRSIVQLTTAHGRKIYFSGPMIRHMERQPDGQKPTKEEGWREVWGQLGGTTLSLWDMKAIEEASKQGRQVPPSYINVTDAFVHAVGTITVPGNPSQKYPNVIAINTAGVNLILFSCPSGPALVSWVAAIRLAAWEKSRLEEMYTAHLIRITLNDGRAHPTPLVRGRMEGWVRIRVAGQTDWKRMWMVITAGGHLQDGASISSTDNRPISPNTPRKKRMSNLFSREKSPPASTGPVKPLLQLFASPKTKDRKKSLLTLRDIAQAFAVYPERPELISRSTLMKLEGLVGDEEMAGGMRNKEGWLLVMPEFEGGEMRAPEMLKWLIGIHDAFELYGRPRLYIWDPRDPRSMMFAYPIGPHKDLLFLDRELAEPMDPRDDRTSYVRSQLLQTLWDRMRDPNPDNKGGPAPPKGQSPSLPPLPEIGSGTGFGSIQPPSTDAPQLSMQLPPLDFEAPHNEPPKPLGDTGPRALTPITEYSVQRDSGSRSISGDHILSNIGTGASTQPSPIAPVVPEKSQEGTSSFFGGSVAMSPTPTSPVTTSPPSDAEIRRRLSEDSFGLSNVSRADSKSNHFGGKQPASPPLPTQMFDSGSVKLPVSSNLERQIQAATSQPLPPPAQASLTPVESPPIPQKSAPQTVRVVPSAPSSVSNRVASPRPASPSTSVLTSPHSTRDSIDAPPSSPHFSVLTSPHSVLDSPSRRRVGLRTSQDQLPSPTISRTASLPQPSPIRASAPASPATTTTTAPKDENADLMGAAASALYYMQHMNAESAGRSGSGSRRPPALAQTEDDESSGSDSAYTPPPRQATSPLRVARKSPSPPAVASSSRAAYMPPRRGMSMGFDQPPTQSPPQSPIPQQPSNLNRSVSGFSAMRKVSGGTLPDMATSGTPSRFGTVAKPTGARAAPGHKITGAVRRDQPLHQPVPQPPQPPRQHLQQQPTTEEEEDMSDEEFSSRDVAQAGIPPRNYGTAEAGFEDHADALAALNFLEREDAPPPSSSQSKTSLPSPPPPVPQVIEPPREEDTSPSASIQSLQHRSSFAPSKQAAERKAKSQAQQAAHQAVLHKPGRANGKPRKTHDAGAWGESSDEEEEEEEEEEDDEDADSDEEPVRGRTVSGRSMQPDQNGGVASSSASMRAGYPPSARGLSPGAHPAQDVNAYPQARRPRDLPQLPGQMTSGQMPQDDYLGAQPPRRLVSDQYSQRGSMYPEGTRRGASPQPALRPQSEFPQPGMARQSNMWSQVLDPGRGQVPERDTFVQIEPPSQTMTKAFAPHGLLSAGLQDKQDRSAKRQEELARETGASLINVPNKPPPPQTGLLGAVTAHERERKREGGLGATLTEREREKRLAEERQRKMDDLQRMQLEQMQQGGSMYGGMGGMGGMQQFPGYNPMMANPMMSNPMMPMMTGGWGYPGMMNPQHMFAAQQAAQAYQQAMMAFSVAGSQAGGDGGAPAPLNPMMTGGSMLNDPRFSMMGMGMMNPAMGMSPGMSPAMGMGQGMGQGMSPGMGQGMNPMGMGMGAQMTGGSGFDARFSSGFGDGGLHPPSEAGGASPGQSTVQRPYSSQNSSANGQGSPAGGQGSPAGPRPVDGGEVPPRVSANASPSVR